MPGVLATYGCGYHDLAALNLALVYVSITPFGQSGPKASYADSDLILLAASGPLIITGDSDRPPGTRQRSSGIPACQRGGSVNRPSRVPTLRPGATRRRFGSEGIATAITPPMASIAH